MCMNGDKIPGEENDAIWSYPVINNSPFLPVCPCQSHADPGSPYSDWQNVRWPENVTIRLEIKNASLSYLTWIYLFI